MAPALAPRDSRELLQLGDQHDVLEQLVDPSVFESRHLAHDRVASPRLGYQTPLRQLLKHPVHVGVRTVDLVDRHDDRNIRRARVIDRLHRLGHDAVVCCNHQNHDVCDLSSARTHSGERLVPGSVDKRDRPSARVDLVRAYVLGDPTRFILHQVAGADSVEQQGLAVVDMPHHGHHWRPRSQILLTLLVLVLEVLGLQLGLLLLTGIDQTDLGTELGGEELDHVVGERLRGRDHLALKEQEPDDVACGAVQLRSQLTRREPTFDYDLAVGNRGVGRRVRGELSGLELLEVAAAPARSAKRRTPSCAGTTPKSRRGTASTGAPAVPTGTRARGPSAAEAATHTASNRTSASWAYAGRRPRDPSPCTTGACSRRGPSSR